MSFTVLLFSLRVIFKVFAGEIAQWPKPLPGKDKVPGWIPGTTINEWIYKPEAQNQRKDVFASLLLFTGGPSLCPLLSRAPYEL